MANTWAGTAANQLLTGAALRDGAAGSGNLYTVDVTIPTADNLKIVSTQYIVDHTTAGTGGRVAGNCPTKQTFTNQF